MRLRVLFGISILLGLFIFFDIKNIVSEFSSIDSKWFYLAAISIVLSTFLGAISMFIIVSRGEEMLFQKFLPVYWSSWAVGLVVPGQIGDLASISILLKRWGFDWSLVLARSLVDKVITFIIMTIIAIYGLTYILSGELILGKSTLLFIFGVCILALLFIYNWRHLKKLLKGRAFKLSSLIDNVAIEMATVISKYPLIVTANSVITVLKIILIGSAYWFIFKALGNLELSFWEVLPLMAASSLIAYLPISFNGIGTVELTGIVLFSSIGIPEVTTLSAFILLRLLVFTLAWFPTVLILLFSEKITGKALS